MYTLDKDGNRLYTLKKVTVDGKITKSAHPARFSPDDKYSRYASTFPLSPGSFLCTGIELAGQMMKTWMPILLLRTQNIFIFPIVPTEIPTCYRFLTSSFEERDWTDWSHRHRVTLKKRYGLLLTQQRQY